MTETSGSKPPTFNEEAWMKKLPGKRKRRAKAINAFFRRKWKAFKRTFTRCLEGDTDSELELSVVAFRPSADPKVFVTGKTYSLYLASVKSAQQYIIYTHRVRTMSVHEFIFSICDRCEMCPEMNNICSQSKINIRLWSVFIIIIANLGKDEEDFVDALSEVFVTGKTHFLYMLPMSVIQCISNVFFSHI